MRINDATHVIKHISHSALHCYPFYILSLITIPLQGDNPLFSCGGEIGPKILFFLPSHKLWI